MKEKLILSTLAFLFLANVTFAAGGACAGTVPAGVASCFYVSAAGADTNNGTTEVTSWAHAPGMPSCTNTCAATTLAPGNGVIFRGGDTWGPANLEMGVTHGGLTNTPIYYGVDGAWFTGGTWRQPIFDAQHATVSGSSEIINIANNLNWITIDNLELKNHKSLGNFGDGTITMGCSNHVILTNLFIHGWTSSAANDGQQGGIIAVHAGSKASCDMTGSVVDHSTITNVEACTNTNQTGAAVYAIDLQYSTIHDVATAQQYGRVHDTLIYNVSYPACNQTFDPTFHTNTTYIAAVNEPDDQWAYNNVIHDYGAGSGGLYPVGCLTFRMYNNVIYNDQSGGNRSVQIDQFGCSGGIYLLWNNTFQNPGANIRQVARGTQITLLDTRDNHFITDTSPVALSDGAVTWTNSSNLQQTNAAAMASGYTSGQTNQFSPTSGSSPTVGAGANLTSLGIPTLDVDRLGVSRSSTTGAWDAGAYQFNSGTSAPMSSIFAKLLTLQKEQGGH